jgi:hypothetical protein
MSHIYLSHHSGWLGSGWTLLDVPVDLYVTDMPKPSRQVELRLYAVDTAFILVVTFSQPTLIVIYLQTYLNDLDRCLRDWRIAISVSKSTVVFCIKTETLPMAPTISVLWGANPVARYSVMFADDIGKQVGH